MPSVSSGNHCLGRRPLHNPGQVRRMALIVALPLVMAVLAGSCGGDSAPTIEISSPASGDEVQLGVEVSGTSDGLSQGQAPEGTAPWAYVVVRPIPGDPAQFDQ